MATSTPNTKPMILIAFIFRRDYLERQISDNPQAWKYVKGIIDYAKRFSNRAPLIRTQHPRIEALPWYGFGKSARRMFW
jgi:hypothetical protein